jgi:hypothetical protein
MTAVKTDNKKYFSDSQEIPAMVCLWFIANAVFLVAIVTGMLVKLYFEQREFMASIGKRIFSICMYRMYHSLKLKLTLLRYICIASIFFNLLTHNIFVLAQNVLISSDTSLCYKPEGRGFESR